MVTWLVQRLGKLRKRPNLPSEQKARADELYIGVYGRAPGDINDETMHAMASTVRVGDETGRQQAKLKKASTPEGKERAERNPKVVNHIKDFGTDRGVLDEAQHRAMKKFKLSNRHIRRIWGKREK